ncbi:2-isopropylmalate synthase [Candidatus Gracilibacteria bacterium]|nr:2-isopropylmalate synthase [Candidatus Gracilibacteria bacterium]
MGFELPDGFDIKTSEEINFGINEFGDIARNKYFEPKNSYFEYPQRTWPDKKIEEAPTWCSVDLRDGNQSLLNPMSTLEKLYVFKILVEMGYKEIEVGFPAASEPDFEFIRALINHKLIPDDVTIQVLCQCREDLVEKTRKSLEGAKNVIVHIYNSTSEVQRELVFKHGEHENIKMPVKGVDLVKEYFKDFSGNLRFQYSPESFTGTEMEYALDVTNAVIETWGGQSIIINLPATVENCTPNVFADKVEFMKDSILNFTKGEIDVIISLHTHRDRGTGEAASELGMLAGGTRIEGCNLDFGERCGNTNLVTLAMNMFSQGIPPGLDFGGVIEKLNTLSKITNTPIGERQPYVGKWTHTAFSGSHQDAIRKGFIASKGKGKWENPYLPIDPTDIGMEYEPIIVNSQSGKGGAAYIIEEAGYIIPKAMHSQIGLLIQKTTEIKGEALTKDEVVEIFRKNFIKEDGEIEMNGFEYDARKNIGLFEQFELYIKEKHNIDFETVNEAQQAMGEGKDAMSCAFVHIQMNGNDYFGIGEDVDIAKSPRKALISALNIALKEKKIRMCGIIV